MGVAQAMVLGAIFTLLVSWCDPQKFSKEFFRGMGNGYGDVMGIIIAAGVFAAGLRSAGLIDAFVTALKASNELARWGGSLGPFVLAVITGSGDAATFAFNEGLLRTHLTSECRFLTSVLWHSSPAPSAVRCLRSPVL